MLHQAESMTEGVSERDFEKNRIGFLEKKRKNTSWNTVLPPTASLKPQHKRPTRGQYAAAQTFGASKKRHPFFD
jgi:hypothetical protein